jgi:hypothetical protein
MTDAEITALTERELIAHVLHELRQKSAACSGWVGMLVQLGVPAISPESKQVMDDLQATASGIVEINRQLTVWVVARKTPE